MNFKKLFFMLTFVVLFATTAFAQNTIYVDATNGSNAYTGVNEVNNPAGTGPKATLGGATGAIAALANAANGGTIILKAGNYAEALDFTTTLPALVTSYTITLKQLNVNNDINFTGAVGATLINKAGLTVTINQFGTTERINTTHGTITFTAGNINLSSATAWVMADPTTITMVGTSGFTNAAPTKTNNVFLSYTGGSSFTAGPESGYGSFGTGTITVGKNAGTTVTFPSAITAVDGIIVTGGNATFSAAVTHVPSGSNLDITNSGTGALSFNSTLGMGVTAGTADANLSSVENTSSGSISVTGTTTWTGGAIGADRDFAAVYGILNSGTGSLSLGAISLVASDGGVNRKFIFEARNSSTGGLTLGTVSSTVTTTNTNYGALRLTGTATAGTINIAGGTYRGFITILGTHTLNVTGATSLILSFVGADGIFTNAGTTTLSGNLTLSTGASVAHLTNGGVVNGTAKLIAAPGATFTHSFNGGTFGNLEVAANAASGIVNFITNAFTISTLDLTSGSAVGLNIAGTTTNMNVIGATVTVATTIVQTVTNFSQTGGSFTLAAGGTTTLDVKGNFNRTAGVFATGGAVNTLVSFTGSGAQSVNGGPLFQVEGLTFNNAGGTITVGNSIRATGTVTIATATNVDMSTLNLILNGAGNGMINNGTYTATGGGGVILGGTNTVTGGVAGNGFSLQGTGTYSYVTVDVGGALGVLGAITANDNGSPVQLTIAGHGLTTGDVVFITGNADIPAGYYAVTFVGVNTFTIPYNNTGGTASTTGTVTPQRTAKITTTLTGVKFNGVLTLRSGALSIATAGLDFGPTGSTASIVRYPENNPSGISIITGATFNSANVSYDLTYTGAITAARPVGSELISTPANVRTWTIQTTGAFTNTLPANANVAFGGTLNIANTAVLNLPAGTATNFALTGTGKTHSILGAITLTDGGDFINFSGATVNVNGGTATADVATLGNTQVSSTGLCTFTNIKGFTGTFVTNALSNCNLGMDITTTPVNNTIVGAITLGGSNLTLTTPIVSTAGVTHNAGVLAFGANNLTTNAAFTQTAGSYTSTGGYLVFGTAANLTLTSAIPYLRAADVAITLGSAVTVSENLDITNPAGGANGTITSAGFNLTLQKTMTTIGGVVVFSGAGNLILAGDPTTVTASGNPTISNLTVNTTGTASLVSSVLSPSTPRTFTISGVLTHTAGDLANGTNPITLSGGGAVYTRTTATGQITGTGQLTFGGTADQTAAQGTGFTYSNLTINNTTASGTEVTFAGGATNDFTVTGTLRLTAGVFSSTVAGKLHIGNLATIERFSTASSLAQIPTFDGDVNLSYRGATGGTGGNEMPTAASDKLNNLLINLAAGGNTFAPAANMSYKGTFTLTQGTFGNGGFTVTGRSGSTIAMNGGVLGNAPTVTNYNLTYLVNGATTANDFINGAGISVDLLTINPGAGNTVTLHAARSVKDLTITSGTLANGGFNLTVLGNFNGASGAYTGAGALIFNGTTAQTMTVPAAGYALGGNLTINNATGVTLSGGNLTMNAGTTVTFTSGVLTTGANWIQFAHAAGGQGFTRTNGWVNGNVRHFITAGAGTATYPNGRYEFPVGTATMFRPYAITFTSTYPAINPTNIIVGMVDASPEGSLNLDAGNGLKIAGYPNYYWLVTATPSSFTSTQLFDVELTGTNIGIPYTSDQNLRIIRRQDGQAEYNPWALQNGSTYANYSVISGTDTTAVVRTTASIGGIVTQGTRFSIGVPARVPTFGASLAAFTVAEGATTANTVQITATPSNSGETITGYTKVSGPAWAAVSTTGLVTLTPGFTDFAVAPYPVVVRATTSLGMTADHTLNVTVTNTNRAPSFTATGAAVQATASVNSGATHTFTYLAVDADTDALTYTVAVDVAPTGTYSIAAALGTFTFNPVFADAGKTFTFTVTATDPSTATATTTTAVTVGYPVAVGDVTGNGTIAADDASEILKYVVGLVTFTPQQMYAADVNNDTMVGALDAAWILYYVVNGTWPTAKMSAAMGSVEIGQLQKEAEGYLLPINLAQTTGVLSVYAELDVDANVEVLGVTGRLPQGWISSSKIENGKVMFAFAGLEPLKEGSIAYISLRLKDKEANATIFGNANLNDGYSAALNSVTVREIPSEFALSQNYPNPFNPTTSIKFAIPENANVQLNVYNMLGQKVRTIMDGMQDAGYYTVNWDGTNDLGSKVSSGIYIYRISAGKYNATMKMNLLK